MNDVLRRMMYCGRECVAISWRKKEKQNIGEIKNTKDEIRS